MKKIKVIIGSNFGDEGKGLMTDFMCFGNENPIVIRFNSSAQAGHTVVTKDGKRHVFGHFGSGSLQGVPTFLSKYFSINPILFAKEYKDLEDVGVVPKVIASLDCPIVTVYDMLLNQIIERHRGKDRHGSCGLGYNESIKRNEKIGLNFKNLISNNYIYKLDKIRKEYVPNRLKELGIDNTDDELISYIYDDDLLERFIYDINTCFLNKISSDNFSNISKFYDTLVFEGAQGLMLHENYKYFPHVTHSKTGLENVIALIKNELQEKELANVDIEAIYITRSYLTRHGRGPLPGEVKEKLYKSIIDNTNIHNEFQESLRFAPLNIDILKDNINEDYNKIQNLNIKKSLAITCLDQVDDGIAKYYINNTLKIEKIENFIEDIKIAVNPENCYLSYGCSREKIKC